MSIASFGHALSKPQLCHLPTWLVQFYCTLSTVKTLRYPFKLHAHVPQILQTHIMMHLTIINIIAQQSFPYWCVFTWTPYKAIYVSPLITVCSLNLEDASSHFFNLGESAVLYITDSQISAGFSPTEWFSIHCMTSDILQLSSHRFIPQPDHLGGFLLLYSNLLWSHLMYNFLKNR